MPAPAQAKVIRPIDVYPGTTKQQVIDWMASEYPNYTFKVLGFRPPKVDEMYIESNWGGGFTFRTFYPEQDPLPLRSRLIVKSTRKAGY